MFYDTIGSLLIHVNFRGKNMLSMSAHLQQIRNKFKELDYYAGPKVDPTPRDTLPLAEDTTLAAHLGFVGKPTVLIRILTALYCKDVVIRQTNGEISLKEAHEHIIMAQQKFKDIGKMSVYDDTLSETEFETVCDFAQKINQSPNAALFEVLLDYFIVYSDLAKTDPVKQWAKKQGINIGLRDDDIMSQILQKTDEEVAEVLPSFSQLNSTEQVKLRLYYPLMTAFINHLLYMEAPVQMLNALQQTLQVIPREERKEAIDFVVGLVQRFILMGGHGSECDEGSLTYTRNMHGGFLDVYATAHYVVDHLDVSANLSQEALNYYCDQRAKRIGIEHYQEVDENLAFSQMMMQLVCLARIYEPQRYAVLLTTVQNLSQEKQLLLMAYLPFIHHLKRTPDHVATGFGLIGKRERESVYGDPQKEMVRFTEYAVCFAAIIKAMQEDYPEIFEQTDKRVAFSDVSFFAGKCPEIFNSDHFDPRLPISLDFLNRLKPDEKEKYSGKSLLDCVVQGVYPKKQPTKNGIAVFGTTTLDSYEDHGERIVLISGGAARTAVAAAQYSEEEVTLITTLSDNGSIAHAKIRQVMKEEGILLISQKDIKASVSIWPGEYSQISPKTIRDEKHTFDPEAALKGETLHPKVAIFIGSPTLSCMDAMTRLAKQMSDGGTLIVLDINSRKPIDSSMLTLWAQHAHIIKIGQVDVPHYSSECFTDVKEAEKYVVQDLLSAGTKMVIATHGKEGATAYWINDNQLNQATVAADVIENIPHNKVGAGDAFDAGIAVTFCNMNITLEKISEIGLSGEETQQLLNGANQMAGQALNAYYNIPEISRPRGMQPVFTNISEEKLLAYCEKPTIKTKKHGIFRHAENKYSIAGSLPNEVYQTLLRPNR